MPQPWLTAPCAPLLQPCCPPCEDPPASRPPPAPLRLPLLQLSHPLQRKVLVTCARAERQTVLPFYFPGAQLKRYMPNFTCVWLCRHSPTPQTPPVPDNDSCACGPPWLPAPWLPAPWQLPQRMQASSSGLLCRQAHSWRMLPVVFKLVMVGCHLTQVGCVAGCK